MTTPIPSTPSKPHPPEWLELVQRFGGLAVVAALVLAGFFGSHWLFPTEHEEGHASLKPPTHTMSPQTVTMSPTKLATAQIQLQKSTMQQVQISRTLPGSIQYDATTHLQITTPADCTVKSVLAPVGTWVQAGQPLVLLTSTEIGVARNEAERATSDLKLATAKFEWAEQTDHHLRQLLDYLKGNPSVDQVEQAFRDKVMGDHWTQLVSAYSQYLLAQNVIEQTRTLQVDGAIAGRTSQQRISDREIAGAAFKSSCEENQFQSQQDLAEARALVAAVRRAAEVANERVAQLLGPYGQELANDQATRSDFVVTAPNTARVERVHAVTASRLKANDALLELANTRVQWVSAHVHQSDWDALKVAVGQAIEVTAPAIADRTFVAHVKHIGAELSPTTLSIPIVSELDNADGSLRPGMFVRVRIPIAQPRMALVVPTSAIQQHENQKFVFVREQENAFRRVDVITGEATEAWTEITGGLQAGVEVVSQGAFFLKSELLLEDEE